MAYISPHILNTSDRKRREREVVQQLMRHASSRFTLEIYPQAFLVAKRKAQRRLVEAILLEWTEELAPAIQSSSV